MKQTKETKSFKDHLRESIDESIDESFASYGGTNAMGTVQGSSKNKYSPATVLKAPPVRHLNTDVVMGQSKVNTQADAPLIYPFEGIFGELVDLYMKLEGIYSLVDKAKELPTLTDAKKQSVVSSGKSLEKIIEQLHKVIKNIEEVTI